MMYPPYTRMVGHFVATWEAVLAAEASLVAIREPMGADSQTGRQS